MQREEQVAPSAEKVQLSDEQQDVIDAVLAGKSIFITGAAGVGKSFILKEVIKSLPSGTTYVTASTGVAACNISGITFHSFAGIGLGNAPYDELLNRASRRFNLEKWLKCRALIIDEISMIDGELFEKVEHIARTIKQDERPFGGIQLVLCGDFLQLPPVQKGNEVKKFCFEVSAWERCVQKTVLLKKVFRQKDEDLIGILSRVRLGEMTLKDKASLLKCHFTKKKFDDKIHATKLFPHRISCEQVNERELRALPGECKVYESIDGGKPQFLEQLDKYSRFPKVLALKVGAQVMLLKNLSLANRLVNGSRGVVMKFTSEKEQALENFNTDTPEQKEIYDELVNCSNLGEKQYPLVRFTNGIEKLIESEVSSIEIAGHEVAYRKQVPLALAWAVSVHKAQGMTLERVDLSLRNVFECGQAYVALSRCTSLDGLRLDDFSQDKVRAHPTVLAYYNDLGEKVVDNPTKQDREQVNIADQKTEHTADNVEQSIQRKTFATIRPGERKQFNPSNKFPVLNGALTCGNRLFKSPQSSELSPLQNGHKKFTGKRSMSSRNDFFSPKAKQTKIEYFAVESKVLEAKSKLDIESGLDSTATAPLKVID